MSACMIKCPNCGGCMETSVVESETWTYVVGDECYNCGFAREGGKIKQLGRPQTVDPCEQKPEGWIE